MHHLTAPGSALAPTCLSLIQQSAAPLLSLARWYSQQRVTVPAPDDCNQSPQAQQQQHKPSSGILWGLAAARDGFRARPGLGTARPASLQAQQQQQQQAGHEYAANYPRCSVTINGKQVQVPEGTSVLEAARYLRIHIPTLCTHPRLVAMGAKPPGTCRLCLVDVKGRLVPACATPVSDGMEVATDTQEVQDNVRGVLSLLRANHPDDCMKCESSGRCEFQDLIHRYKVDSMPKLRDFSHEWDDEAEEGRHDDSSAALLLDFDKCIKCGRCVTACNAIQNMGVLGMMERGGQRHPGTLAGTSLDFTNCIECGQCASVCPTDAIHERSQWEEVMGVLEAGRKTVVAQTAPAVRVAIGEELGLAPGEVTTGQMVAAQRALGFDYVFDTNFSADLTIMEEGTELLRRLQARWDAEEKGGAAEGGGTSEESSPDGPLPMFTSCCPAWINAVEKSYPDLIPHLSTCKSPQMMLGAVVKRVWAKRMGLNPRDVVHVSIMPCTAKKHEAGLDKFAENPGDGSEAVHDVDYVLTTRELGQMLRYKKIPLASLPEEGFDSPLGESTGAGALFANSGGVAEAAVRTAYALATGHPLPGLELGEVRGLQGVKQAEVSLRHPSRSSGAGADRTVRVAVASGIGNARHLLERMRSGEAHYDLVEVMACPGGCIGGGGQPKSRDPSVLLKRMGSIYEIDRGSATRESHKNRQIAHLYEQELGGAAGSHVAHSLLHTHYEDLSRATVPPYAAAQGPSSGAPRTDFGAGGGAGDGDHGAGARDQAEGEQQGETRGEKGQRAQQ